MTNINIGLNRREALGHALAYDYQLSFSPIPAAGIQCDVSSPGGAAGPCWASLFLHFPTFERQISTQDVVMDWEVSYGEMP